MGTVPGIAPGTVPGITLGIGIASMHINAAPFYVMIFAVMAGGPWNWAQATGAAIVILGVLIAQGRFRA